jgi:hypothetical protein
MNLGKKEDERVGEQLEDPLDFLAKFVLDPNLEGLGYDEDDFKHINKNLTSTNLKRNEGENDEAKRLSQNLQLLNQYNEPIEDEDDPRNGEGKYDRLIDIYTNDLHTLSAVASGTGASILKLLRTAIRKEEQSLEQFQEYGNSGGIISGLMGGNKK